MGKRHNEPNLDGPSRNQRRLGTKAPDHARAQAATAGIRRSRRLRAERARSRNV